jgi:hypothetical protein
VREPVAGERAVVLRDLPPGDVVQVTGTPVPLTGKDTDIPDWTIPWSQWGE